MAVSPALLYGADFDGNPNWAPQEVSPLAPSYRDQPSPTMPEPSVHQSICLTNKISASIDSYAKAKVIAVMAISLFVHDVKLDGRRNRWACPFTKCKDDFPNREALMRHVPSCDHFTGDWFYCNCCGKGYNLCDHNPNHHVAYRDGGVSPIDKGSTTSKAMRRISQIFTRSRSASRASSGASRQLVSPTPSPGSTTGHQNVRSIASESQDHSDDSRKQCVAYPSELPSHPDFPTELPSSDHSADSTTTYSSQPNDPTLSAINTTFPMFTGGERFTESPVEDIPMDSQIPDSSFHQGYDTDVLPEYSQMQDPSVSAGQFPPQSLQDQHHSSWNSSGKSVPPFPFDSQQSQDFAQDALCVLSGSSMDSHVGVSSFCTDPYLQQSVPSSSRQSTSSQSRHGSGDSYVSIASRNAPVSGRSRVLGTLHTRKPSDLGRMYGALSESSSEYVAVPFDSPPSEMEDYHCPYPYCRYRPKGDVSHRKAYLKKHITNKHERGPIPCPDCGKEISRMDNLKTHQKTSCRKVFSGLWQSMRRPAEQALGRNSVNDAYYHAPKRQRQGSRGW